MDEKKRLLMASSCSSGAMVKQGIGGGVEKQQQEEEEDEEEETAAPPRVELGEKCPRCDSVNTKFCYYNNYSLSQPRHLCKGCKRYWTRGGTLRKVPVGGGCRKKNKQRLIKIIRPPTVTTTTVIAGGDHHQVLPSTNIANPMMLSGSNYTNSRVVVDHLFPQEAAAARGLGFSSTGQLLDNGHRDFLHNYYSGRMIMSPSVCPSAMTSSTIEHKKFIITTAGGGDVQLDDYSGLAPMNYKVQPQTYNYNYPLGNGNGNGEWNNNYLGYQMEEQQVIGSTTDPANYYWSMSNDNYAASSNNWHDPPPPNTHESPLPSFFI